MNLKGNLTRSVADVVSVEGWTENNGDQLAVHIDVAFRTTSVGGEERDAVRFKLSLLRAELVALIPSSEGIKIIPKSVARDRIRTVAASESISKNFSQQSSQAGVGLLADLRTVLPDLEMRASNRKNSSRGQQVSESRAAEGLAVQHRKDQDGNHRWELISLSGRELQGSGWSANEDPRFAIEVPSNSTIERHLILQVRCLREDISLTNIEVWNESAKVMDLLPPSNKNKILAAEAFIKTKLSEQGLFNGDISNRYAEICLFETAVEV